MRRFAFAAFIFALASNASAQSSTSIPRTPDGHPDFGGVWANEFRTTLERPPNATSLLVSREEAQRLFDEGLKARPDMSLNYGLPDPSFLAKVRGEFRSSQVTQPETGRLPYTPAARASLAASLATGTDSHDQRPWPERCIGGVSLTPLLVATENNLRRFVQTPDLLMIHSEQFGDTRIVGIDRPRRTGALPSEMGQSVGRWEGDTLLVETAAFSSQRPVRAVHAIAGSRLVVGTGSRVVERFTLTAPDEILYQFTVEDPAVYSATWSAEYPMHRSSERMFEFACHEGNYALVNILKGAREGDRRAVVTQTKGAKP
ncbi:MAG: hypothetical protein Q8R02_12880 [Hyphomonadaceae bacterium]|nr:hypothetical protein [Hyphomonadaceae bacterium]